MRKISEAAAKAFVNMASSEDIKAFTKPFTKGDTYVYKTGNGVFFTLYGHTIAAISVGKELKNLEITLDGHNTLTTRERLNAIFEVLGSPLRICNKKGNPHIVLPNDKDKDFLINSTDAYRVNYKNGLDIKKVSVCGSV